MGEYFDLGGYTRPVTTSSPAAQLWFDRGLVWAYGFNHDEAVACFERVIEADPQCALGYWGLAYALGPNYNKPWEAFGQAELASSVSQAFTAAQTAATRAQNASPAERALAGALAARYPAAAPAADCNPWNAGYAGAMREVYRVPPRRPGRGRAASRRTDEPHAVGPVGPGHRAAGRRGGHGRGPGRAGAGPGSSRRHGPIPGSCTCTST